MELSKLTPLLESHNVKNVAVGLEEFGLQEFLDGNYFNGDLYIDVGKKTYQALGYKRYGTIGVLMSLLNKTARDAMAKVCRCHYYVAIWYSTSIRRWVCFLFIEQN